MCQPPGQTYETLKDNVKSVSMHFATGKCRSNFKNQNTLFNAVIFIYKYDKKR